ASEGVESADVLLLRAADMRFVGQSYELEVPLAEVVDARALAAAEARFRELHERTYGHASADAPVEFVNLRATAATSCRRRRSRRFARAAARSRRGAASSTSPASPRGRPPPSTTAPASVPATSS